MFGRMSGMFMRQRFIIAVLAACVVFLAIISGNTDSVIKVLDFFVDQYTALRGNAIAK